jgi:hypothetical protein
MADPRRRRRSVVGLIVAASLTIVSLGLSRSAMAADGLPAWRGGIDLYRDGVFTVQRSWLWCTAAGVQITRNIVAAESDHTTSGQRRYFAWMREHNRYHLPLSAGVDPQGWAAGLRHFVDDRYRLVASTTFDGALRSAVRRLRQTNLPVALTVSHGNHGWILTGFTATADPLATASFEVTSVQVTGPLYGLQSRNGYDMPPDTKLTPTQLQRFFTPWRYVPTRMAWDGRYVSIQPVPVVVAAVGAPPPASVPSPAAGGLAAVAATATVAASSPGAPAPAPPSPAVIPTGQVVGATRIGTEALVIVGIALLAILAIGLRYARRRVSASGVRPRLRPIR